MLCSIVFTESGRQYTLSFSRSLVFSFSLVLSFAHTHTYFVFCRCCCCSAPLRRPFMCACLPACHCNSTAAAAAPAANGLATLAVATLSLHSRRRARAKRCKSAKRAIAHTVCLFGMSVCVCAKDWRGGEELAGRGGEPTGSVALFLSLFFLFLPNELAHWK